MVPSGRKLLIFWDSYSHILAKKPSSLAYQTETLKPPGFYPLIENLLLLSGIITASFLHFLCLVFLDKSMLKLIFLINLI